MRYIYLIVLTACFEGPYALSGQTAISIDTTSKAAKVPEFNTISTVPLTPPTAYIPMSVDDYVHTFKNIAIEEMHRTGVPASITLAQGIVETNAGNSNMARLANNHFGIKCHADWNGPTYIQDDDRRNECFRKYDSAAQSFHDHSDFLRKHSRYDFLFALSPYDYKGWAYGLKQAGYATNSQYAPMLIKAVEENGLAQYDMTAEEWEVYKKLPVFDNTGSKEDSLRYASFVNKDFETSADRMFLFNGIKTVAAGNDETLGDIAQEFNIPIEQLLVYNDLSESIILKPGEKVYLQPKRSIGSQASCLLKDGKSLWNVSQRYGIQLKYLYSRNLLKPGDSVRPGEVLWLKDYRTTPPQVILGQTYTPADSLAVKVPVPVVYDPPAQRKITPAYSQLRRKQSVCYVVRKGDTLYSISRKFHTDMVVLKKRNNLHSDIVRPGQTLVIRK